MNSTMISKCNCAKKTHLKDYDSQAFAISERSRARTLLELLKDSGTDIRKGVDPKLLEAEQQLQAQIDAKEKERINLFKGNPTDAEKAQIKQEIESLYAQYQELQDKIRAASPAYANLKFPQPLNLKQVQEKVLDSDTILLQYSLGKYNSYLWAITKDGYTSYKLPPKAEIEKIAQELYQKLDQNDDDYSKTANQLSQIILAPAADKLTKKRILVVSDGYLNQIPFAVLPIPNNTKKDILLTQYQIVNAPSSSSIAIVREERKTKKKAISTLAIFADPVYNSTDERIGKKTKPSNQDNLDFGIIALRGAAEENKLAFGRLPGTKEEAETISKLLPQNQSKTLLGFQVNLKDVMQIPLNQYKVLHFATHGLANSTKPELSGLVLSLFNEQGESINGFLRLNEIFNLDLNAAELVVLSACETGLGKNATGEGMIGITRGFMYAGSPRLIASQGTTVEQAKANLTEALELFFETASPSEIANRLHNEIFITRLEVAVG